MCGFECVLVCGMPGTLLSSQMTPGQGLCSSNTGNSVQESDATTLADSVDSATVGHVPPQGGRIAEPQVAAFSDCVLDLD